MPSPAAAAQPRQRDPRRRFPCRTHAPSRRVAHLQAGHIAELALQLPAQLLMARLRRRALSSLRIGSLLRVAVQGTSGTGIAARIRVQEPSRCRRRLRTTGLLRGLTGRQADGPFPCLPQRHTCSDTRHRPEMLPQTAGRRQACGCRTAARRWVGLPACSRHCRSLSSGWEHAYASGSHQLLRSVRSMRRSRGSAQPRWGGAAPPWQ